MFQRCLQGSDRVQNIRLCRIEARIQRKFLQTWKHALEPGQAVAPHLSLVARVANRQRLHSTQLKIRFVRPAQPDTVQYQDLQIRHRPQHPVQNPQSHLATLQPQLPQLQPNIRPPPVNRHNRILPQSHLHHQRRQSYQNKRPINPVPIRPLVPHQPDVEAAHQRGAAGDDVPPALANQPQPEQVPRFGDVPEDVLPDLRWEARNRVGQPRTFDGAVRLVTDCCDGGGVVVGGPFGAFPGAGRAHFRLFRAIRKRGIREMLSR
uniref:(northern house mosquito) hypothetical protein n=1 Tax=Culex pipiens TaxID=7175 RepID=A0A8D8JP02_CULPI